jgi:DNA-binding NarL/FixJ family response regulator
VSSPIRVAVVDDQTLVRQGIRSLLELTDVVEVVAEAADGREALDVLAAYDVDVLLLDLRMPGLDGVGTLEAMAERGIGAPALVLTTFDDDELMLRAFRAGAKGFLLKDVTLDLLVEAIQAVAAGRTMLQPALTDRLLRAVTTSPAKVAGNLVLEPLTERELDVLRLAAAGWSNKEIAAGLHLADGTVKNHMSSVLAKLGVRDRTRAVLRALDLGLLTRDSRPTRRGGVSS